MPGATCPSCLEPVTVPLGADPQTVVRCPLCQEEFELALVLETLPPSLIVVSPPARTMDASLGAQRPAFLSAGAVAVADAAGADSDAEDEFRLAADEDAAPRPFQLAGGAGGTATVKAGQRAPARAKKQKNPLVEMAKIVAGGVVGLSIGYVLVWWLPLLMGRAPRDPVQGVAPMVGRYVPWIVPAQLRGASSSPDNGSDAGGFDATAADRSLGGAATNPPRPGNGQSRPGNGRAGNGQSRPAANGPAGNGRAAAGSQSLANSSPAASTDPFQVPAVDAPTVDAPGVSAPAIEPDFSALTPDLAEQLVVGAPQIPVAVLSERVAAARTGRANWQQVEEQKERQRQAVNCYVAWGALGEAVTFADHAAAANQPHLKAAQRLLAELASDASQVEALGTLGTKWIRSSNRANQGAFLVGTVQSVAPHGSLYEVRLALAGDAQEQPLAILLRDDPGPGLAAGKQMLVLGAIVTDPELNLSGYSGSDALVVVAGSHDVVSASVSSQTPDGGEPPATIPGSAP